MSIQTYNNIRGTQDLFGKDYQQYDYIKHKFTQIASKYGAQFIQTSTLDSFDLFVRTSGADADICQKEMFFTHNNQSCELTTVLKPEGTAPTIRALNGCNVIFNQALIVAYFDRMFRYNRPQKGRLREFTQAGIEFFGTGEIIDAQAIASAYQFLKILNINDLVVLKINTLGNASSRQQYATLLLEYFQQNADKINPSTLAKAQENPLRALDKLTYEDKTILFDLPKLYDSLDQESQQYMNNVLALLDNLQIPYQLDHTIVRGLDYYTHTVFEFCSIDNGNAQNTLLAGGRYDNLVGILSKQQCSAIGWAAGVERIMLAKTQTINIDMKICILDFHHSGTTALLAEKLRSKYNVQILSNVKLSKAFDLAEAANATYLLICGEDEIKTQIYTVKNLLTKEQHQYTIEELLNAY